MKKMLVSATALGFLAGSAIAADLPSRKAPVPPPPPPMWTGFYAGLNAGYGWGGSNQAATSAYPLSDQGAAYVNSISATSLPWSIFFPGTTPWTRLSTWQAGSTALANTGSSYPGQGGFIGGGQIGYNWQLGASFVSGVEADFQGSLMRGSGSYAGASSDLMNWDRAATVTPTVTSHRYWTLQRQALGFGEVKANVNWIGTIRGRLGYLLNPNFLVYGTGGLAYGGVTASTTNYLVGGLASATETPSDSLNQVISVPTIPGQGNISTTLVGWTAGGGAEWMVAPNWSIKAEALYYDLGSVVVNSSPVSAFNPDLSVLSPNFLTPQILSSIFGYNVGALAAANAPVTRVRFDGVIARAGVNYHFNWSAAPVVAKY